MTWQGIISERNSGTSHYQATLNVWGSNCDQKDTIGPECEGCPKHSKSVLATSENAISGQAILQEYFNRFDIFDKLNLVKHNFDNMNVFNVSASLLFVVLHKGSRTKKKISSYQRLNK